MGHLQGKRGFAPYSGVGACVMFSSLVAPHGSTSQTENMNMNAFKKTLVAIATVATLGGLVSPRLPPDTTTATDMVDMVAGIATASPPTATAAIPHTTAIPRTATATSPTVTATAAAEGWLVHPRAGVVGYRPCVSCGRIRSAAPRRHERRGAILFMRAKSR